MRLAQARTVALLALRLQLRGRLGDDARAREDRTAGATSVSPRPAARISARSATCEAGKSRRCWRLERPPRRGSTPAPPIAAGGGAAVAAAEAAAAAASGCSTNMRSARGAYCAGRFAAVGVAGVKSRRDAEAALSPKLVSIRVPEPHHLYSSADHRQAQLLRLCRGGIASALHSPREPRGARQRRQKRALRYVG